MEAVKKVIQHFNTKKRRALAEKKATAGDRESEVKSPAHPPPVGKCRRSSESDLFVKLQQERKEQLRLSPDESRFRSRGQTMSYSSYFAGNQAPKPYMKDRVLTENAKKLTPEQMQALELDIFKPLDFYGILFERMKARDNGDEKEEKDESTVMDWQDFKIKYIRN